MAHRESRQLQAFTTRLDGRLIQAMKMHSATTGITVQLLVDEAVRRLLAETPHSTHAVRQQAPRSSRAARNLGSVN